LVSKYCENVVGAAVDLHAMTVAELAGDTEIITMLMEKLDEDIAAEVSTTESSQT
jgi:hypothetical protein